jgi:hypothetical protein
MSIDKEKGWVKSSSMTELANASIVCPRRWVSNLRADKKILILFASGLNSNLGC